MKKTIAVIGDAENMGSSIAHSLALAGYQVLLTDDFENHPLLLVEKLPVLFWKIRLNSLLADLRIVLSAKEASWEADIIIPAVPYTRQVKVAAKIRDFATGKVVISVINPNIKTHEGSTATPITSAAEELAQLLPHSRIVKGFCTTSLADFKMPYKNGNFSNVPIAGDDPEAVLTVIQLVKDMGFNPHYVGNLSMSRMLEKMKRTVNQSSRAK